MAIPWEIIIPAVIEMISMCIENNSDEEAVRSAFRNPTDSQRALIEWKVLRSIPLRDRIGKRREILDEFWARAACCTDAEINYLMSQA